MSEFTKDRISVTLKFTETERYAGNGPWIVFEGNSPDVLKGMIAEATGLSGEGIALADLVLNAQQAVSAAETVARNLGGTVIETKPASAPKPAKKAAAAPKKVAEPESAAPEASAGDGDILAAIAACNSKDELTDLWHKRKAEFIGGVRDAFRERAKEVENG